MELFLIIAAVGIVGMTVVLVRRERRTRRHGQETSSKSTSPAPESQAGQALGGSGKFQ